MKNILKKTFKKIIGFEIVFKILTISIVSPIFLELFKLIMKITGFSYLTTQNLVKFLINPITIVLIFLLLLGVGFYSAFEIGVILLFIESSRQDKKVAMKDIIITSLKKSLKIFKPKNFRLLIILIALIPFLWTGAGAGMITALRIPEFITDFIFENAFLACIFIVIVILLELLLLKWVYSLNYYFLEDLPFRECCKKSGELGKGKHIKDIAYIVMYQILLYALFVAMLVIGIFGIILCHKIIPALFSIDSIIINIYSLSILSLYYIMCMPILFMSISMLFYKNKTEKNEKIKNAEIKEKTEKKIIWNYLLAGLIILAIVCVLVHIYNLANQNYNLNIEDVKNMQITAHRGASILYPENTMSAFEGARELGAAWIELDVQQTKDGYIIVSHDSNLKRTTGKNINTYEATLEEIEELDVGSWKDEKFAGEKIPLLDDVIKWAKKNNMKLNIELKPTGYEKDFELAVINIIMENNFKDKCVLTSLDYNVLVNIKKINKDITTVGVLALAFGNILDLTDADYFSLEASNINYEMVTKLHEQGKQVYAWTVNTEESISQMIEMNVDNIITDDITLGKKMVTENNNSDFIKQLVLFIKKALV